MGIPEGGDNMINYQGLSLKLDALGISGDVRTIKENAFYDDIYINFLPSVTFNKVKSRKRDLEIFLDSPVELTSGDGCIIIRLLKSERKTETLFDYLTPDLKTRGTLPLIIGKTEDGGKLFFDLAKMPHLLIGGATGSGKSVFMNSCILSLVYGGVSGLCLIDVKRVEFSIYEGLANLNAPIAYDFRTAKKLLKNVCFTMDNRYKELQAAHCRSITEYNKKSNHKMQYITVIIDEMADLFMQDKTVEPLVVRIAQLGRAAGVHLILATQRPDSTIVSGLIRANVPSRVCFAVQKATDSRIILDESGGERLKGAGDGFFRPVGMPSIRFQAPFIETDDIIKLIK